MKTTPKTDEQLDAERMLPAGEYDFTVVSAVEKMSKSNNEMIELTLTIFSGVGERTMKDWLLDKLAWKVKHFAYAVGVEAAYEAGGLDASTLVGRSGKVVIKQGKANGDFSARNEVKDYVVPVAGAAPTPAPKPAPRVATGGAAGADEVPFNQIDCRAFPC